MLNIDGWQPRVKLNGHGVQVRLSAATVTIIMSSASSKPLALNNEVKIIKTVNNWFATC